MARTASEADRAAAVRTLRAVPRPAQAISEIVQGSKRITAETALELSAALGTSAEVWLQLDAGYRLRLAEERPETAAVRRAIVKRSRERAGVRPPRGRSASR
jgi:addiction module HigA family antidote